MALIKCENCGRMVSDKARACPHCGKNFVISSEYSKDVHVSNVTKANKKRKGFFIISGLVALLAIVLFMSYWLSDTEDGSHIATLIRAHFGESWKQYELGNDYYYDDDYENAVKWYRKAAEQGDALAQCNLGWCYENGFGVSQDYDEAVKWYRKAAEQGLAKAQNNLGVCYQNGFGVSQDYVEAVKWYFKASEGLSAGRAQFHLGDCYEHGYGVDQNINEAITWYQKAAEYRDNDACEALKRLGY